MPKKPPFAPSSEVITSAPSTYTATCAPPLGSTFSVHARFLVDQGGNQVTEVNGSSVWQHSNFWAAGKLSATWDYKGGSGGLHFELADPLGTKRVQVSALGKVEENCYSLPFGNDVGNPIGANCVEPPGHPSTADDATEHHFTGKERDAESGNDYFEARYYSSAIGRFMSPDWSAKEEPLPYAKLGDPQSLNLYSYVESNPLIHVDADGHCCESDFDSFQTPAQANYFHQAADSMDRQFFGALGSFVKTAATLVAPELGVIYAVHDAANGNYGSAGLDLAGAIPVWGLAKGAGILENAAQGAAGEAKVAGELLSEGKTILGSQVGVQTGKGLRRVDHLVQEGEKISAIEVKTGTRGRNASQLAKDASMESEGGKIVGKNAPENLRGQTVKIPTEVRYPQP